MKFRFEDEYGNEIKGANWLFIALLITSILIAISFAKC